MTLDRIELLGMEFWGFHGCLPEERAKGQPFIVDITLLLDLSAAGKSDALQQTINYAEVYEYIKAVVEGEAVNLIEALAERIAAMLLRNYASLQQVQVKVHKPKAPIPGVFADVNVNITRTR